jgi:hypothetical protein
LSYLTIVLLLAELLRLFRSCVEAVTVAVLINSPDEAVTLTTMLMLEAPPLARLPTSTVTVPLLPTAGAAIVPCVVDALVNTVPGGSASDTVTRVAVAGPPLLTVSTYVIVKPGETFVGADNAIPRSADVDPPPPPETTL